MRAVKARALKAAMPPHLRAAIKDAVRPLAAERASKVGAARSVRNAAIADAHAAYGRTSAAAWADFEAKKAKAIDSLTTAHQRAA